MRGLDRRRYGAAQGLRGVVDVVKDTLVREAAKHWMANNVKKIRVEAVIDFGKEDEVRDYHTVRGCLDGCEAPAIQEQIDLQEQNKN